ncbi:MAG TPA: XRE family transcriptional regulator [Gaiellaceae bacterium]|nr:XRE family transcriptional regulator [Gaiellaceae bacterium]
MAAEADLGARFRALRTVRGLSLVDVAAATGISTSFLSLFETGKSDITFGRLSRLVAFYGIPITELLPDPEPDQSVVVRRNARRRLRSSSEHAAIEILSHSTRNKMLPLLVTLEPSGVAHETSTPAGGELLVFVLRGDVEVVEGDRTAFRLRKGDAAYLRTDRERAFRNVGEKTAEWLAVQTPTTL